MKKIIATLLAALLAATPISAAALKVDNNAEIPKLVLDGTWENSFFDVAVGDWFYDGVMFAYEKGMMNGVGDGAFAPSATLTRAMMITVLYRNAGSPQASGSPFSDVGAESWYAGAAAWGSASKVVSGTDDGRFLPEAQITREQLAVMLYNYAKLTGKQMKTGGAAFEDSAEISPWAAEAMDAMTASGILGGDAEGRLRPKSSATRAETAVILKRFFE